MSLHWVSDSQTLSGSGRGRGRGRGRLHPIRRRNFSVLSLQELPVVPKLYFTALFGIVLCLLLLHTDHTDGAITLVPNSSPSVGNCIPWGSTSYGDTMGMIYSNIGAFTLNVGDTIEFDRKAANDVNLQYDLWMGYTVNNLPGSYASNSPILTTGWKKIDSAKYIGTGTNAILDWDVDFVSDTTFNYPGGSKGLVVLFQFTSASSGSDSSCTSTNVHATASDSSGYFFGRLYHVPLNSGQAPYHNFDVNSGSGSSSTISVMRLANTNVGSTPPSATADSFSITNYDGQALSVLSNDSPGSSASFNYGNVHVAAAPSHGTAVVNTGNGQITYTPQAGYKGSDSFTYYFINTASQQSSTVTVSLSMANQNPVANADTYSIVTRSGSINVLPLANDQDGNKDTLTVTSIDSGSIGSLVTNSNGDYTYTLDSSVRGVATETLSYTISDGTTTSDSTVTINVNIPNSPPVAVDDTYTIVVVGGSVNVLPLLNDTDSDNDSLTVQSISTPVYGTLQTNSNGDYTYTVDSSERVRTEILSYVVSDGEATDTGSITIDIAVSSADRDARPWTYVSDRSPVDGTRYSLNVTFDAAYDVYFNVTFPNSNALQQQSFDSDSSIQLQDANDGFCDFSSDEPDLNSAIWDYITGGADSEAQLDISGQQMLSNCGFVQDPNDRGDGKVHFIQTVIMSAAQTRDTERETLTLTREVQYIIDIGVLRNATATVDNLQVYGTAFVLDLLGDMVIDISPADQSSSYDYVYTVTGRLVTSTQYPYRLEELSHSIDTALFNSSTWSTQVDSYCDVNDFGEVCQQEWTFAVELNSDIACISQDALQGELVNISFTVNCSDQFSGECAPDFAVDPGVSLSLSSPDLCPTVSNVSIESDMALYAYGDSSIASSEAAPTSGSDSFFSTTQDVPPSTFVNEALYVYESTAFGEVTVTVPNNAATLSDAKILSIVTDPIGFAATEIYSYDSDTLIETKQHSSVVVNNDNFGTGTYSDSRARFAFQWNADTVNIADSDRATTIALTVLVEVAYAEGVSSRSSDSNPVLSDLDQHNVQTNRGKSSRIPFKFHVSANSQRDESGARAFATLQPSSGTSAPASSSSTLGMFTANTLVIGATAFVVIAIVIGAVVVVRRRNSNVDNDNSAKQANVVGNGFGVIAPIAPTVPVSSSFVGNTFNMPNSMMQIQYAVAGEGVQMTTSTDGWASTSTEPGHSTMMTGTMFPNNVVQQQQFLMNVADAYQTYPLNNME
jgi:VCBS repeat-containing protein